MIVASLGFGFANDFFRFFAIYIPYMEAHLFVGNCQQSHSCGIAI
jgi:hypothetical protein